MENIEDGSAAYDYSAHPGALTIVIFGSEGADCKGENGTGFAADAALMIEPLASSIFRPGYQLNRTFERILIREPGELFLSIGADDVYRNL